MFKRLAVTMLVVVTYLVFTPRHCFSQWGGMPCHCSWYYQIVYSPPYDGNSDRRGGGTCVETRKYTAHYNTYGSYRWRGMVKEQIDYDCQGCLGVWFIEVFNISGNCQEGDRINVLIGFGDGSEVWCANEAHCSGDGYDMDNGN